MTLTRFDPATQEAFFNLYTKIDPTILPAPEGMDKANATMPIPVTSPSPVEAPVQNDTNYAINA